MLYLCIDMGHFFIGIEETDSDKDTLIFVTSPAGHELICHKIMSA